MDFLDAFELMTGGGAIAAFVLFVVRTTTMVLQAPILGFGSGFSSYRIALIISLAGVLYMVHGEPLSDAELAPITLGAMALREALIGFFLGSLLRLVTLALHVTGEMIAHEMGFMIARQVDPATGVQTTLITGLYENMFLLALLALNGHHWLLRGLADSFVRAPVGELFLSDGLVDAILRLFTQMFEAGLVLAAPVMVFLALTSISIGLLARAVPQLNIMELGFSIRVSVAFGALVLFSPMLEPSLTSLNGMFVDWLHHGLDALEG
ncbi:MAG: flagellar biosynthetic protein FliR [Gammaproteobacteria bacterium]|jgi:flagellar biosynthetic protein FliR